ncbi:MAG: hypothetical protein KF735_18055 [Chelatococcus sp.]|uniref:hypothetical protein n=1 Tax=Chelatococcus sp. TaxID=1953771 RepID=UPI0025BA87BE|nr:hypothetical protein [Chelatococcus sp.]MBX3539551.1 hypothetical protein [Chelatococcus sp.]
MTFVRMTLCCALFLGGSAAAKAEDTIRLELSPQAETVYDYATERCRPNSIPDSPARALRRSDGSVALIGGHLTNWFMEGPRLDDVKPNCAISSRAAESPNPADFDDRYWIQALLPVGEGRVIGLGSQEFMGKRHKGVCDGPGAQSPCWYSSIVTVSADAKNLDFSLLPQAERLVASSSAPFDPKVRMTGFFTASNIVREGQYLYFVGWTAGEAKPGPNGNCLFRSTVAEAAKGEWKVLSDGQFTRPPQAYRGADATTRCDNIGGDRRGKPPFGRFRSIVRLKSHDLWLATYNTGIPNPGVFYTTSKDLVNWSEPRMLADFKPFWQSKGVCADFYEYPSFIDPASDSDIFDTAGDAFYVYFTRLNWTNCKRGMDRDIVRFPVRVVSG